MTSEKPPHWDMTSVYPSLASGEFRRAVQDLVTQLDDLDRYLVTHDIAGDMPSPMDPTRLAAIIEGYLERMNAVKRQGHTLGAYVRAFVTTDSYNMTARRLMSELEPLLVRLRSQEMRFSGWIGAVAGEASAFEAALDREGPVREHAFYLREAAEQSLYLMSVLEETLAADLSLTGGRAWQKLQGVVTSQLKAPFETEPGSGRFEDLPITVIQNKRHDPDEDVRRRAYEVEMAAWESVREPLAACLNGVKGEVTTLNQRRARRDSLHEPLDQARIDTATLDAMLGAVHDSLRGFRHYWQAKARRLGKDALAWWDLFAPSGSSERHYSYTQAREFILSQFAAFSDRLVTFAERAIDSNWIDAEARDGKRGGAFCMSLPAMEESRILCNFDGSLDQVLTLAHELGHAYHNRCLAGKPMLLRNTPMTLAETASIFNETVITDALLAQAASTDEELSLLETFLVNASQIVVDIYSRFLFEREVFERRADAELSADDFCSIMLEAQRETYGDGLDPRYMNPYMWAWKPHYYRPALSFYNFPYTFGLLFGLGLYSTYREGDRDFLSQYDDLLASTGMARPDALAARFGIDIHQRAFWDGSLKVIADRIERYVTL